jgi:hypothetical protein
MGPGYTDSVEHGSPITRPSPEGLTGEGGKLGVGGEQHQLFQFRLSRQTIPLISP